MKKPTVGTATRAKGSFFVHAQGHARLSTTLKVPAEFYAKSNYGYFPGRVEVRAAKDYLQHVALGGAEYLQVELCGLRRPFRCKISSYTKGTYRLQLDGASFFGGLARALTEQSLPFFMLPHIRRTKS
jgi:hypothetical protein